MLFLRRSAILLITMILIVSYLIINLRASEPVISTDAFTVVIDAGHGNPDGGCKGNVTGTLEKDVNLIISLLLQKRLEKAGINVIMTRSDDNGIYDPSCTTIREKKRSDLKNRVRIANESNADLLVSIHMNYFGDQKSRGPQIFYRATEENSERLATGIRQSFINIIGEHCTREIKPVTTEIFLLRESNIPSVLVECGFMSNKDEEMLLVDSKYQDKTALSIAEGIISYLTE